jgi:hypothetical protein
MDKNDKKKLKAWKSEQKEQARAAFPLQEEELEKLFDFLDISLEKNGCDHTLRQTKQWIDESNNSQDAIIPWLGDNGGYCDCEVLANVYDHFEQNRKDA